MVLMSGGLIMPRTMILPSDLIETQARSFAFTMILKGAPLASRGLIDAIRFPAGTPVAEGAGVCLDKGSAGLAFTSGSSAVVVADFGEVSRRPPPEFASTFD